jgi:hypothetical protein
MHGAQELSFTYFPTDYRWSHGLLIGLNAAPWGGAEIGEVNRVGLRLKNSVGDDDAWFREWAAEARTVEDAGRAHLKAGRKATAPQGDGRDVFAARGELLSRRRTLPAAQEG